MRIAIGVVFGFVLAFSFGAFAVSPPIIAKVDTNGVLKGYTVQKGGKTICKDPIVWNDFRGQGSFIICD